MARFLTAGSIVRRAAKEVGLGDPGADPFASSDPLIQQMCGLLTTLGQYLVREYDWGNLKREWSFTTTALDTGVYALPADFDHMVPQTGWDRTNSNLLGGPQDAQVWQYLKARDVASTVYVQFRVNPTELWLYPQPPPVGVEVALEYMSDNWLSPEPQPAQYRYLARDGGLSEPTASTDICLIDPSVLITGLKLDFLNAKGFDSSSAKVDYNEALEKALSATKTRQVLSLTGQRRDGFRYISEDNLPDRVG